MERWPSSPVPVAVWAVATRSALGARGARVVVADLGGAVDGGGRSSEPADDVVEEIRSAGGEAIAVCGSVADEHEAQAMVDMAIDTYGRVDVLINNAGIGDPELFEDQTVEQFQRLLGVHYLGVVYVSKAVWPRMVESGGGRIVNTCSEGPLGIHEKMTAYGGAKGGAIGFTLALAAEGPKYGISVNGFSPRAGTRLSAPEIMAKVYDLPKEHFEQTMGTYPPELASPAAIYLAHETCPLNGVILVCGGGQVLRMAFSENQGYLDDAMTAEAIAAHVDQIVDMTDARPVELGSADSASQAQAGVSGQGT